MFNRVVKVSKSKSIARLYVRRCPEKQYTLPKILESKPCLENEHVYLVAAGSLGALGHAVLGVVTGVFPGTGGVSGYCSRNRPKPVLNLSSVVILRRFDGSWLKSS